VSKKKKKMKNHKEPGKKEVAIGEEKIISNEEPLWIKVGIEAKLEEII
jgi:hypothetical protein